MPGELGALTQSILDTHHALLKKELPRLGDSLRGRDPAVRVPLAKLRILLDEHLFKEEQILFPMIFALEAGTGGGGCGVDGPIAQMRSEHDVIRGLEAELRRAAHLAGDEEHALIVLLDDLSEHARKEDDLVFPQASTLAAAAHDDAGEETMEPPIAARAPPTGTHTIELRHLGWSGLAIRIDGATITVDPPEVVSGPVVLTWSEKERVAGARGTGPLAATPVVLEWLERTGVALADHPVEFAGFTLSARFYDPIPYATPPEALRKAASALKRPLLAARRLAFTARRPTERPVALRIERSGASVLLLGQALHRFLSKAALYALAEWAGPVDLVVAGTDFDDERATGELLAAFPARLRAVADLTGEIRHELGLPVRELGVALAAAPAGTESVRRGGVLRV